VQHVREEIAHLTTLKSKSIQVVNLLQRLKQEWQKSPAGTKQTDNKNMVDLEK
jgi:hypothetical protein